MSLIILMSQVIVTLNKILLFITTTYHSRQVAFSSNEFQNQLPNGILPSVKPTMDLHSWMVSPLPQKLIIETSNGLRQAFPF